MAHPHSARRAVIAGLWLLLAMTRPVPGAPAAKPGTALSALEERVMAVLQRSALQHPERGIQQDPRLHAVARANSRALAGVRAPPEEAAAAYLRFLLFQHRVRDAVISATAVTLEADDDLEERLDGIIADGAATGSFTHAGAGAARARQGRATLTVILVRRHVEIERLEASPGQPLVICGKLRSGRRPRVLVTAPDGRLRQSTPRTSRGRFCAKLPGCARGQHQVELMVDGPYGPEVAALFPLAVGVPEPQRPVQKLYPDGANAREHVEIQLFRMVNASRRQHGLPPLEPVPELASVARTHSLDMRRRGYFGHRSPGGSGLAARLSAAGVSYSLASENLALSTTARRAHQRLMESPSHRGTILDRRLTHLGVGVAEDRARGLLYVTQCFVRRGDEEQP